MSHSDSTHKTTMTTRLMEGHSEPATRSSQDIGRNWRWHAMEGKHQYYVQIRPSCRDWLDPQSWWQTGKHACAKGENRWIGNHIACTHIGRSAVKESCRKKKKKVTERLRCRRSRKSKSKGGWDHISSLFGRISVIELSKGIRKKSEEKVLTPEIDCSVGNWKRNNVPTWRRGREQWKKEAIYG